MIDENEAGLASARGHVANLAHGLKTPLATLAVRLREPGRDPDGALAELVERIDRSIRHHLGRARTTAGTGAGTRIATPICPASMDWPGRFPGSTPTAPSPSPRRRGRTWRSRLTVRT